MCYALASAYSGSAIDPGNYDTHTVTVAADLKELVVSTIKEGCIEETISALDAQDEAENEEDPVVQKVLRQIAVEEGHHTAFAYKVIKWAVGESLAAGNQSLFQIAKKTFEEELERVEGDTAVHIFECLKDLKSMLFQSLAADHSNIVRKRCRGNTTDVVAYQFQVALA